MTTGNYKVTFVPGHLYEAGYEAGLQAVARDLEFKRALRRLQQSAGKGVRRLKLTSDDDVFKYLEDPEKWKRDKGIQS